MTAHIRLGISKIRDAARCAVVQWRQDLEALPNMFSLPFLPEVLKAVNEPEWPTAALFSRGAKVEYLYYGSYWYRARVDGVHLDGTYAISFETLGFWGSCVRHVPAEKLRLAPDCEENPDKGESE